MHGSRSKLRRVPNSRWANEAIDLLQSPQESNRDYARGSHSRE
jgi:hypothetical protein